MNLDAEHCYQALLTHDARFDGVFYVGVATTRIYCRPVCPARTPRRDRCTFYPSAAAAEQAGYRPCRRCRPELAPGPAQAHCATDAGRRLGADAAARIEGGALTQGSVAELAAEMDVSERHLRRVLRREFGVTPVQLAQTQRLLLAKRLLTDTSLPIGEIAFASGFSSLRRFNTLFQARYRLPPTELRRKPTMQHGTETLICEAAYRAPLDWNALREFLVSRTSSGVEALDGSSYLRTVQIAGHSGWISVAPSADRPTLCVTLSASLAPAQRLVLARVRRLFDLAADPRVIAAHLGPLAAAHPGLRLPGAFDGFELAVRAILGQQVTVNAAATLAGRFAASFGAKIETPFPALTHLAPTAARVAAATAGEIAVLGIFRTRAEAILALARAVSDGTLALEPGGDPAETIARLKTLPGIGDWTAQYIAMRALAWPDAFPHTDYGLLKALGETAPKRLLAAAEPWRPWRAYAAMHLWKSLEYSTKKISTEKRSKEEQK